MSPPSQPRERGPGPAATPPASAGISDTTVTGTPGVGDGSAPPSTGLDSPSSLAPSPAAGSGGAFGKYELVRELAAGGMGVVYEARDRTLGRRVALKCIRGGMFATAADVRRFQREAQAAAQLSHPHIVPVHEVGEYAGHHYFTMALVTGGSLADHRGRFAEPRAAAALLEKVARAVHHAHQRGVLHRDLKPGNILLDERDEPLVADFGLAKVLGADVELTQTGDVLGTPAYMAPEQATGRVRDVGVATDVWALGVLLYELVAGRRPFPGPTRDELRDQIRLSRPARPSAVRPACDAGLEAVILTCLAKEPAQRYASAELLANDLARWLRAEQPVARLRRRSRRRLLVGVAGALGGTTLGMAAVAYRVLRPARPDRPVVLVGPTGPPPDMRQVLGPSNAVPSVSPDQPFSVQSAAGLCLIELLAAAPWQGFRLEGELRHDGGETAVEVGLYFAYERCRVGTQVFHCIAKFGFADGGYGAGRLELRPGVIPDGRPWDMGEFNGCHWRFSPVPAGQRPWRSMAVELTAEEARAYWADACMGTWPRHDMERECARALKDAPWNFQPWGPLGLYVGGGAGSFRNVRVKPLA